MLMNPRYKWVEEKEIASSQPLKEQRQELINSYVQIKVGQKIKENIGREQGMISKMIQAGTQFTLSGCSGCNMGLEARNLR